MSIVGAQDSNAVSLSEIFNLSNFFLKTSE